MPGGPTTAAPRDVPGRAGDARAAHGARPGEPRLNTVQGLSLGSRHEPSCRHLARPGATAHEVVADLSVLEAAMAGTGPAVAVPGVLDRPEQVRVPEETAVVIATSGTTGRPKPALLTADALRHAVHGLADVLGTGQSMLAVPPPTSPGSR